MSQLVWHTSPNCSAKHYLFGYSGYDCYNPVVLTHSWQFTPEEFEAVVEQATKIAVKNRMPIEIKNKKGWVKRARTKKERKFLKKVFPQWSEKEIDAHWKKNIRSTRAKSEMHFSSIFDDVLDILCKNFGFAKLEYTAELIKSDDDVVGVIPAVK